MRETENVSNAKPVGDPPKMPLIVTVLVNWKGADDTLECLESLRLSDYPNQRVVVVDNGSGDGSLEKFEAWATGDYIASPEGPAGESLISPRCPKPVPYQRYSLAGIRTLDNRRDFADVVFIDAGKNAGFAGGVNVGLRTALSDPDVKYVWVLNNDTVVARDCLSQMERRIRSDLKIGMCGSRILDYARPDRVQVLGGAKFRRWTGTSHLVGMFKHSDAAIDTTKVESSLDHLSGASMLVSRRFVEIVGPMDEGYFLYYEEADWAMRSRAKFSLAYADDAIVLHKLGASIGSGDNIDNQSPLAAFFLARSRIRFTGKFFPWALPSVFVYTTLAAVRSWARGNRRQAKAMFAAIRGLTPSKAIGWKAD